MNRFFAALVLFFLTACSGPQLTLSDDAPRTVAPDSLVSPPWEALVKAGPGAEKDIDFETLNGPQVAAAPAPVETPVTSEPAPTPPKPGDTVIKAVAVLPVTGAGGSELTAAMRKVLKDAGWPVISSKRADALTLQGSATLDPAMNGQQNNAVPAGSLISGWGENAGFATQAAATGIFKLIDGFR
jgi:hypothetical protein